MSGINKLMLTGNLTRPVELKYTPKGVPYVTNAVANNRRYTVDGKKMEETTFQDFTAWSNAAEFIAKHFKKGGSILLEGRLQTEQWDDKESGKKRSRNVLRIERADFYGDSEPQQREPSQGTVREVTATSVETGEPSGEPAGAGEGDDIPM